MSHAQELYGRIIQGGPAIVRDMIANQVTEELFLDYKRSADDGKGAKLDPKDRSNLSRLISGFANSEGGVVVWGVDCRDVKGLGDIPGPEYPIHQPKRFKTWLDQATSGVTVPAHSTVRHQDLSDDGGVSGFVVSLIPSGDHAPYQAIPELAYYMRAGSSFARVPHAVLAGMFGRRPQPRIETLFSCDVTVNKTQRPRIVVSLNSRLTNNGQGVAYDVFLNLAFQPLPKECSVNFSRWREDDWVIAFIHSKRASIVAMPHLRLAPGAEISGVGMDVVIQPPFDRGLVMRASWGAAGAETRSFHSEISGTDLDQAFEAALAGGVVDFGGRVFGRWPGIGDTSVVG